MKLKRVKRLDSITLDSTYFTEEGYLRDKPIVTTCGIFEYANEDGSTRYELRLPEDVFKKESLESYKGKPIIVTHDAGEITKDNVEREQIGTILAPGIKEGDSVRADIVIHNTKELKACGLRELSLGYDLDLDETPGVYEGQHYDAIQRNILINHLALVEEARAGSTARLNIDGKSHKTILKGGRNVRTGTKKQKRSRFDSDSGLTPEQMQEAVAMYLAAQSVLPGDITGDEDDPNQDEDTDPIEEIRQNVDRRDSDMESLTIEDVPAMQEEMKALLDRIDELEAEKDMSTDSDDTEHQDDDGQNTDSDDESNNDSEDEETKNADSELEDVEIPADDKRVNMDSTERVFAEMMAISSMAAKLNLNITPKSIIEGKKAIVKAINPGIRLDGKSSAYINGAYLVACDTALKRKNVDSQKRQAFGRKVNMDASGKSLAETSRENMLKNMRGGK